MKETLCLQISKELGGEAIQALRNLHLLNNQLAIKMEGKYLVIPFSREPAEDEVATLRKQLPNAKITMDKLDERQQQVRSLNEALRNKLPPNLLVKLPHSMDIIGHVAILELSTALESHKSIIGEAVMEVNKGVQTVLTKVGAVSGERRIRPLKTIAGTGETETVYREHGCTYLLDPTKVYFSPRLSQERSRMAQKVKGGEVVIDMFAGVGPFSIQIAKKHRDATVYAIDVNPDAIKYMNRNISANKISNVIPMIGDAKEIIRSNFVGKADRVIMNLPESALKFIKAACEALKPNYGVIHYYGFEAEPDALEKAEADLEKEIEKAGRTAWQVLDARLVRPTAPHEWQVAIDVQVT